MSIKGIKLDMESIKKSVPGHKSEKQKEVEEWNQFLERFYHWNPEAYHLMSHVIAAIQVEENHGFKPMINPDMSLNYDKDNEQHLKIVEMWKELDGYFNEFNEANK